MVANILLGPAAQQRNLAQYDDCNCPRWVAANGCAGIVSYGSSSSCLPRMVPVSFLPCRMRTTNAGLEVLIDDDTAIDREPRLFRQRDCWPYADPHDDEIGLKAFSGFQRHVLLVYRRCRRAEPECHAMILMELAQELPDFRSQHFLHQDRLGPHHVNFDVPGTKRRRYLQTNEAGADHDRALCRQSAGDQRAAVSQRP